MGELKCPLCGASMVLRTAKRGPNSEKQFYGCSQWHSTNCEGTIETSAIAAKQYNEDVKPEYSHFVPTLLIAKPYYKGFEVFFCQSIATPFEILQAANREEISIQEIRKYSQWRADYRINQKVRITPEVNDVFKLMKKSSLVEPSPY